MFWIILVILALAFGAFWAIYSKDASNFCVGAMLACFALIIGSLVCGIAGDCIVAHDEIYDSKTESVYSVSIGISGGRSCYFVTTKNESGEYDAKEVYIKKGILFDDEKEDSYIKTLYVRNSNPVARFFLFTYGEKYEIHVSQDKIKDARLGSPR